MVDKDRVLEGLAPHQKEALDRLANGRILCGDVGSGKSRVGGAYWLLRKSNAPLVIITTAKKRDTGEWEQDLKALGCSEGYEVDSWNNIKKYSDRSRCLFIFDEQRLVGGGAWVKAFYRIARHRRYLAGLYSGYGCEWLLRQQDRFRSQACRVQPVCQVSKD